jgi:hypothetical protein
VPRTPLLPRKEHEFMSTNIEEPDQATGSNSDGSKLSASDARTTVTASSPARKPLRIWPISDLHLARAEGWSTGHIPDADAAVVAGDVCEGVVAAIDWLAIHIRPHMPIVFVPGNHEFYGECLPQALMAAKDAAIQADIHLLDGDAIVIRDVRFTGATLWTDYSLFGEAMRASAMMAARSTLNDHRQIAWSRQPWQRFRPQEALALHQKALLAIEGQLVQAHHGPTIVVTHHAPHIGSIPQHCSSHFVSAAYASDLTDLITRCGPDLWIH